MVLRVAHIVSHVAYFTTAKTGSINKNFKKRNKIRSSSLTTRVVLGVLVAKEYGRSFAAKGSKRSEV